MEYRQTDEVASLNTRTNTGLANAASFEAVDDVTWRMVNSEPVRAHPRGLLELGTLGRVDLAERLRNRP